MSKTNELTALIRKAAHNANENMIAAIDFLVENKISLTEEMAEQEYARLVKDAYAAKNTAFGVLEKLTDAAQELTDQHELREKYKGEDE